MIQRIQSLYLLIITALMVTMFFADYATVSLDLRAGQSTQNISADGTITRETTLKNAENNITFSVTGIYQNDRKIIPTTYLAVILTMAAGLAFVIIFLYRKRPLQIRLCFVLAVLQVGILGFLMMYVYKLKAAMDVLTAYPYVIRYSIIDVFPLVALILLHFTYRGIVKDEALVKSLDRIR